MSAGETCRTWPVFASATAMRCSSNSSWTTPAVGLVGDERARFLRGALDEEKRDGLSVGRPEQVVELALDARQLPRRSAGGGREPDLELSARGGVGKERDRLAVGREGGAPLAVRLAVLARGQPPGLAGGQVGDRDRAEDLLAVAVGDLLGPGHARAVGRDRGVAEVAHLAQRLVDGLDGGRAAAGGADAAGTERSDARTSGRCSTVPPAWMETRNGKRETGSDSRSGPPRRS